MRVYQVLLVKKDHPVMNWLISEGSKFAVDLGVVQKVAKNSQ